LHDVGIAGAIIAVTDGRILVEQVAFETIWPALSSVHAQFTVQMAQLWGLPEELRTILRHHHTFAVEAAAHPMAAVTVLSEIIAEGAGFGFQGEQTDCLIEDACNVLRLSAGDVEAIERDAANTMSRLNL
jgi:HD-like signal output (HDOD) protein